MTKLILASALLAGLLAFNPTAAFADPAGGSKGGVTTVKAHSTDVYEVVFRGGEATEIAISGDGDTCLELRVYDENGRLVASDTFGGGDDRHVVVRPKWTGEFTVKVKNLGPVSNQYAIVMR